VFDLAAPLARINSDRSTLSGFAGIDYIFKKE
jgi:hypothetical protein